MNTDSADTRTERSLTIGADVDHWARTTYNPEWSLDAASIIRTYLLLHCGIDPDAPHGPIVVLGPRDLVAHCESPAHDNGRRATSAHCLTSPHISFVRSGSQP